MALVAADHRAAGCRGVAIQQVGPQPAPIENEDPQRTGTFTQRPPLSVRIRQTPRPQPFNQCTAGDLATLQKGADTESGLCQLAERARKSRTAHRTVVFADSILDA